MQNLEGNLTRSKGGESDDLQRLKQLVKDNPNLNVNTIREWRGTCPILHAAARNGQLEVVKFLVNECNAKVDVKASGSGMLPLHYAATSDRYEIMDFLIEKGGPTTIEAKDDIEHTPLSRAAMSGALNAIRLLVEKFHADVNKTVDHRHLTALVETCLSQQLECMRYLCWKGARANNCVQHILDNVDYERLEPRKVLYMKTYLEKENSRDIVLTLLSPRFIERIGQIYVDSLKLFDIDLFLELYSMLELPRTDLLERYSFPDEDLVLWQ